MKKATMLRRISAMRSWPKYCNRPSIHTASKCIFVKEQSGLTVKVQLGKSSIQPIQHTISPYGALPDASRIKNTGDHPGEILWYDLTITTSSFQSSFVPRYIPAAWLLFFEQESYQKKAFQRSAYRQKLFCKHYSPFEALRCHKDQAKHV